MLFFQPPTPTRYDLNFSLAGIPVRVHPLFWLLAALLGYTGGLLQLVIWIVAVFVCLLVHELGHALAYRSYGIPSSVILYWGGGLTVPESMRWGYGRADVALTPNRQVLISLAGPFAGFLLAGLILGGVAAAGGVVTVNWLARVIPLPVAYLPLGGTVVNLTIGAFLWISIFWGVINLVPVYPLDGGSVARNLLIQADPLGGLRKSLWLSVIAGGLVAVLSLVLLRSIFIALLFGLLAFQSYQSLSGRSW
jgi:Zn-dependent protease